MHTLLKIQTEPSSYATNQPINQYKAKRNKEIKFEYSIITHRKDYKGHIAPSIQPHKGKQKPNLSLTKYN